MIVIPHTNGLYFYLYTCGTMKMTGIEAYEGLWEDKSHPAPGKTYRILTTSKLDEGLHQDVWFIDDSEQYLLQGDVIETAPASGFQETERVIVFQVKDIMAVKNILTGFPEMAYPTELDNEFDSLMEGAGWFSNSVQIEKTTTDTYSLSFDFYGNVTEIIATEYEGKLYAWQTRSGFRFCKLYLGKYILPDWIKEMLDQPEEEGE